MAVTRSSRLASLLWFVAAALALGAAVVGYARQGEMRWALLAAAAFLAAMGWSARSLAKDEERGGKV